MNTACVRLSFLVLVVASLNSNIFAQAAAGDAARVEQGRRFRTGVVPTKESQSRLVLDGPAPSSAGDPDLGEQLILKRQEKETPFTLQMDVAGYYTDNAALTDQVRLSDYFLVLQTGISYQKRFGQSFVGDVYARESVFRYSKNSELDFESLNLGFGLTYIAHRLWDTAISAHYNFNRLTDGSQHDEFFKNHTLTLSLLKSWELSKAHYLFAGYSSVFGSSEPVAPQRDEHGIFAGYHVNLTRSLSGDIFYRMAFFDYVENRGDWNQNLTVGLKWTPVRYFSVSTSVSFGWNDSNRNGFDYHVVNPGVGVAANFAF